jgi:SOS-response transcriptional repressor LexA
VTRADRPGDLTPIQHDILRAIRSLSRDYGHPPAMREVLDRVDLGSVGALAYQYRKLEGKGFIRRRPGQPRTVEGRKPSSSDPTPAHCPGHRAIPVSSKSPGSPLPGGSRLASPC